MIGAAMRRRLAGGALTLLLLQGCATRPPRHAPEPPTAPTPGPAAEGRRGTPPRTSPRVGRDGDLVLRVQVGPRGSGAVETIALEEYVRDVVVGELAVGVADASLAGPAYRAQAIVARTYALAGRGRHGTDGFDLCSTTHCQVYGRNQWRRSRWAAQIDRAVAETRHQYLAFAGRPIEAVFHAHCGGHTSAAADVWRSRGAAYLRGVADPYCIREQPASWTTTHELEAVRLALRQRTRTDVGDRLDGVQVLRRDVGGRVVEVVLTGPRSPVVSGEDFRLALLAAAGARGLRSARFEVRREGTQMVFTGRGSGHGVGLCQIGLLGRLRAGQSPVEALRAYYSGAEIVRIGET